MSSSTSPSSSSSSSEYRPEPVAVWTPTPFERPYRSFRIITPADPQNKRKRDLLDSDLNYSYPHTAGKGGATPAQPPRYPQMNQFHVVVREPLVEESPGSSFGPTGKLKAKPPQPYPSPDALLAALRTTSIEDPEVDFSGSYVLAGAAAVAVSDKERVQMVSHDVWRATGYRFTVKDHPKCDRGHKTRLWCSQDEARRSKHRNPNDLPRLSKQGELFAKQRYPCRSRLMITCVAEMNAGANAPNQDGIGEGSSGTTEVKVVTIRMHHYMRHEAYFEAVAAEGRPPAPPQRPPPSLTPAFMSALPPHLMAGMMRMPPPPPLHEGEGEWDQQQQDDQDQDQDLDLEPGPEMSPTPSPHFSPQAQASFAPPPPPPHQQQQQQRIVIDPQLQHHPPPPYQHRTTPHTPMVMPMPSRQRSPPSHAHAQVHLHPPPQRQPQQQQQQRSAPSQHAAPPPHRSPPAYPQMPMPPPPGLQQPHQPYQPPAPPTSSSLQMPPPPPLPHQPPHPQQPPPPQLQLQPPGPGEQPPPPHLTPAEFQHRMRTHIARIRDFCDGLEYQLQFNDYRMLEALERDAAPFLGLVGECLESEGR